MNNEQTQQLRFETAMMHQCVNISNKSKYMKWEELVEALRRIKILFTNNPNATVTPELRVQLAQLLATCLINDENRRDVHEDALDVYEKILDRHIVLEEKKNTGQPITFREDLGLFYSGLFGFYQHASNRTKKEQMLRIIETKILRLTHELVICLPGFMMMMMYALDEPSTDNSDLVRKAEEILDRTEEIVGTSCFYGEIWKTMLRSSSCCMQAIKYLNRKIPRSPQEAALMMKAKAPESPPFQSVNCTTDGSQTPRLTPKRANVPARIFVSKPLMVRRGKIQLKDERIQKESDHLEALSALRPGNTNQFLNLRGMAAYKYFYFPNKKHLVHNALIISLSKERSNLINRATLDFLLTHMPLRDLLIDSKMNSYGEKVQLLECALNTLIIGDYACLTKVLGWFDGEDDDEIDLEQFESREVLMSRLDEQEEEVIAIVTDAFKNILLKTKNKYKEWKVSGDTVEIAADSDFARTMRSPLIIFSEFLKSIVQQGDDCDPDQYKVENDVISHVAVDLVEFIHFFYQEQHGKPVYEQIRDLSINLLTTLKDQRELVWEALGKKLYPGVEEDDCFKTMQLIEFCLHEKGLFIDNQKKVFREREIKQCADLLGILVVRLTGNMKSHQQILKVQDLIKMLLAFFKVNEPRDECREELGKSVDTFNAYYIEQYTERLSAKAIDPKNKQTFERFCQSSQILIEIQRHRNLPKEDMLVQMPDWLNYLIKCSCKDRLNPRVLLIFLEAVINIFEYAGKEEKEQKLQDSQSKSIYVDLKKLINSADTTTSSGRTVKYTEEIIRTLWKQLGKQEQQQAVVNLCERFDQQLPKAFNKVVCEDFQLDKDKIEKEKRMKKLIGAVQKFRIFWKLTEKDVEVYTPFKQTEELNSRSYEALHEMLMILQKSDPMLRLECRQWLTESKYQFSRILDPLLAEFMDKQHTKIYTSFSGQLFFYDDDADAQRQVIGNFKKLRNIIMNLNTQDKFLAYICEESVKPDLLAIFASMPLKENFQSHFPGNQNSMIHALSSSLSERVKHQNAFSVRLCSGRYIQIITCVTLQFIMGQSVSSSEKDNHLFYRSEKINATACEFMELILKSLQKKQPHLLTELTHLIIYPLSKALEQAIKNRNNSLQVHLLNLLRVLLEGSFFYSKEQKDQKIISHAKRIFLDTLFIKNCIIEGLKNEVAFVRNAFITFSYEIVVKMHEIIGPLAGHSSAEREKQNMLMLSEHIGDLISMYTELMGQVRLQSEFEEEKGVIDQEIDAIQLVNGLKNILHYCFGVEDNIDDEKSQDLEKLKKTSKVHKRIYLDLHKIIQACLNCWGTRSTIPLHDYFFTRSGMFSQSDGTHHEIRQLTPLQIEIIDMLKKLATAQSDQDQFKSTEKVIGTVLDVWIDKQKLTKRSGNRTENLTVACETLIEIVLELNLKPDNIIRAVERFIKMQEKENPELVLSHNKKTYTLTKRDKTEATFQSLLCQFIFTILHGCKQDAALNLKDFFFHANKFIKAFMFTRHPNTINWLIEILQLLTSQKFIIDKTSSTEILDTMKITLGQLLKSASQFLCTADGYMQNEFGVNFSINYGIDKMCFSPTVYEMIKRFEFVRLRQELLTNEENAGKKDYSNDEIEEQCSSCESFNFSDQGGLLDAQRNYEEYEKKVEIERRVTNRDFFFEKEELEMKDELSMPRKNTIFQSIDLVRNGKKQYDSCQTKVYLDQDNIDDPNAQDETMGRLIDGLRQHLEKAYVAENCKFSQIHHIDSLKQMHYFQFFTVLTLRQNLITSIDQLGGIERSKKDPLLGMVVTTLIKELKQLISTQELDDTFSWKQKIHIEMYTQVLADLCQQCNEIKRYKKEIMEIFKHENFFKQTECTLKKWQHVMHHLTLPNSVRAQDLEPDQVQSVFEDLLHEYDSTERVMGDHTQQSITFKRLAFIVFSDNNDQTKMDQSQYDKLRGKMIEIFQQKDKTIELKTQLFLLIRILMLRLSPAQLARDMSRLWPYILTELDNVFDASYLRETRVRSNIQMTEKLKLVREGLKLVQLMSRLNIEGFCMNQWMFLFDGFGLQPCQNEEFSIQGMLKPTNKKENGNISFFQIETEANEPLVCQPYVMKYLCNIDSKMKPYISLEKQHKINTSYKFYTVAADTDEQEKMIVRGNTIGGYLDQTEIGSPPAKSRRGEWLMNKKISQSVHNNRNSYSMKNTKLFMKSNEPDNLNRSAANVAEIAEGIQTDLSRQNMSLPEIDRRKQEWRIMKAFLHKEYC